MLELLDVVALLKAYPALGLTVGQVGTVVETYSDGDFEVEFVNTDGETYAMAAFPGQELMKLHHASQAAA